MPSLRPMTWHPSTRSLHPNNIGHDNPGAGGLEAVLADVRRSTVDKARQIVALPAREVLARDSERLAVCATAMAAALREAAGVLLAFGNGGSSSPMPSGPGSGCSCGRAPDWPALPALALTNDVAAVTALTKRRRLRAWRSPARSVRLGRPGRHRGSACPPAATDSICWVRVRPGQVGSGMLTIGPGRLRRLGKMAALASTDPYLFRGAVAVGPYDGCRKPKPSIYHVLWELTVDACSGVDLPAQASGGQHRGEVLER